MTLRPLIPPGQALRRAVRWLGEHGEWTAARVEEASIRFDLSPVDEAFLLREAQRKTDGSPPRRSDGPADR